jgi:predicted Zn-dependent protease
MNDMFTHDSLRQDQSPRSLFAALRQDPDVADTERYMSREDSANLFKRILALTTGGGETSANMDSHWIGNLRWARNRVTTAGDTTNHTVRILRTINGATGFSATNKFDDESLRIAVQAAEHIVQFYPEYPDASPMPGKQQYLQPKIWSDTTYNVGALQRSNMAREFVQPALKEKLVAAGYLQVGATSRSIYNTSGMDAYYVETLARYSETVRNPTGTGSGWAGVDQNDWAKIDAKAISATALKKCIDSADPVAIEPGRYTLIMEPQAVHDLMLSAIFALDRYAAEHFQTVYTLRPGQSKIGLKVFDERIVISSDPTDPECGYIPFDYEGYPYRPVTWVQNGILKELAYSRQYALSQLGSGVPLPNSYSYRIQGGSTTVDEMISKTKRGLLVTRLSDVHVIDSASLLSTGVSRDGLWLIESGKISKAVKNMRFTDSPMFAFNNIESIGPAKRVYASYPTIVPTIKVNDFNFTSLSDAV